MEREDGLMQDTILHLISHYGYVGLYVALMFGIIGLPVPDEMLMIFTGYLVAIGRLHYIASVLAGFLGSITGISISFFIGQRLGRPFLEKYGRKIHITPERLDGMDQWFQRFGKFTVTIGYFVPGVRHLSAYFAGISKWSFGTFMLYAYIGGLIWATTFITLGTYVGAHWKAFAAILHRDLLFVLLVVVSVGGIWWWVRRQRMRRAR